MLKQYQPVVLVLDSFTTTFFGKTVRLTRGQKGEVMEVFKHPDATGYAVEFFNEKGESIAVAVLEEGDIAPLNPDGSFSAVA